MGRLKCTRQSRKGIYEVGDAQMASLQTSPPASEAQSFCPQNAPFGDEDAPAWSLLSPGGPVSILPSASFRITC